MKSPKAAPKHALLLFKQSLGQMAGPVFLIGLILVGLWVAGGLFSLFLLDEYLGYFLLGVGVVILAIAIFLQGEGRWAYVQANPDHLNVVGPFLRVKVSYRRIKSAHSGQLQQIFPPQRLKGSEKSLLTPFFGKTVVVVELAGFPMSPAVLKLFFPRFVFLPQGTGFVFIVDDWLSLSTDIDNAIGSWRQSQAKRGNVNARRYTGE
jgi:hypothetical protein